MRLSESSVSRHPWAAAALLATAATPAAVVLGWLAPRPLDLLAAAPLVLLDIWSARAGSASRVSQVLLLLLGIGLTWLLYLFVARLALWRLFRRRDPFSE